MPAPPIVIGEEFEAMSVSNGDGGSLTIYVTVINADGDFTARGVQTGPSSGVLVIQRANGTVLRSIDCSPGSRALVNLQDGVAVNVPWDQVRSRVSLQGGFRPFAAVKR